MLKKADSGGRNTFRSCLKAMAAAWLFYIVVYLICAMKGKDDTA